jgi:hypothetical protein
MAQQALDAINSAINQYTPNYYVDPNASAGVNSINQQASSGLQDTLNQLKQKISDSLNAYGTQQAAVPAQYQPDYNSHATQAALALRNVQEAAANRGDNGGMAQEDQLLVNNAQQAADASTDTSKNNALQTILNAINQTNDQGMTDLGSAISGNNQDRLKNVATEQGAEYAAQVAAQEKAAELQNAQIVAEINHSGSGGTTTPAVSTNPQINTAIAQYSANGQLKTNNPLPLMQNITSQYANDPAAANAILGGISYNQVLINNSGQTYTTANLADYANALNNGFTSHTMYQANSDGTVTPHDSAYSAAGYKASVANGWYTTQAAAQAAAQAATNKTKLLDANGNITPYAKSKLTF